jgi:hypothetical protein
VVLSTFLLLKGLQRAGNVIRLDDCPPQLVMGGDFVGRKPVGELLLSLNNTFKETPQNCKTRNPCGREVDCVFCVWEYL